MLRQAPYLRLSDLPLGYRLRFTLDQVLSLGAKGLELSDHEIDFLVPIVNVKKLAPTELPSSRKALGTARLRKHNRDFSAPLISNYEMLSFHCIWHDATGRRWWV